MTLLPKEDRGAWGGEGQRQDDGDKGLKPQDQEQGPDHTLVFTTVWSLGPFLIL